MVEVVTAAVAMAGVTAMVRVKVAMEATMEAAETEVAKEGATAAVRVKVAMEAVTAAGTAEEVAAEMEAAVTAEAQVAAMEAVKAAGTAEEVVAGMEVAVMAVVMVVVVTAVVMAAWPEVVLTVGPLRTRSTLDVHRFGRYCSAHAGSTPPPGQAQTPVGSKEMDSHLSWECSGRSRRRGPPSGPTIDTRSARAKSSIDS